MGSSYPPPSSGKTKQKYLYEGVDFFFLVRPRPRQKHIKMNRESAYDVPGPYWCIPLTMCRVHIGA